MVSRPPTPRSGPVGDLLVLAVNPPQASELSLEGCGFEPYRQGLCVMCRCASIVVCSLPDSATRDLVTSENAARSRYSAGTQFHLVR